MSPISEIYQPAQYFLTLENVCTKLAGTGEHFSQYVAAADVDFVGKLVRVRVAHTVGPEIEDHLRRIREQGDAILTVELRDRRGGNRLHRTFHGVSIQAHRMKLSYGDSNQMLTHRLTLAYTDYTTEFDTH